MDTMRITKEAPMKALTESQQRTLAALCAGYRPYGRTAESLEKMGLVVFPVNEDGTRYSDNLESTTEKGDAVAADLGLGWDAGDPPEPNEYDLAEIERMKAEIARQLKSKQDSWERSDTDGFLSQWASGIGADRDANQRTIHENGGCALLSILVDRETGTRVEAWQGKGEWGSYWKLKSDTDAARYGARFFPYNCTGRKLWTAGLRMVKAWLPAESFIDGEGYGLSGRAWTSTRERGTS